MKYPGQQKEQKITEKTKFRSWAFSKTEEGIPICPAGHVMNLERTTYSKHELYPQEICFYGSEHCADCPLRVLYTKSRYGLKIQICNKHEEFKQEVRTNMSSEEGQSIRISRSIQAKGVFGDMKNNFDYYRLKRSGLNNAEFELLMVACGNNLRKLSARLSMAAEDLTNYGRRILH